MRDRQKYCSHACYSQARYEAKIREWKETGKLTNPVKRYLSDKQDGCWKCGITDWQGMPITLDLEHKDGNSDNNSEDNLELLCPNCHSQTDTYKAKNKGNGRHARMVRYHEGKSH